MNNELTFKSTTKSTKQFNIEKKKLKEITEDLKSRKIRHTVIIVKSSNEYSYVLKVFDCSPIVLDLVEILVTS